MAFDVRGARRTADRRNIAVIGAGISGLSAAWLLSRAHNVTIFERDVRLGGHANTVDAPGRRGLVGVDAGFIVFNRPNYPNLTALLDSLDVAVDDTCMSFAVSLDGGRIEYAGRSLSSVFARRSSIASPSHWTMLCDIPRFHRDARAALAAGIDDAGSLNDFIREKRYSAPFVRHFLEPFAAAIWSTPSADVLDYPAYSFLKFFENHGLLQVLNMPVWQTVRGGSRTYVERLVADFNGEVCAGLGVRQVLRQGDDVEVLDSNGGRRRFDDVVFATHANAALAMIDAPTERERSVLGAFRYQPNRAVVHLDRDFMPARRRAWASWNYLGETGGAASSVTYWMNQLQELGDAPDIFVTLNPGRDVEKGAIVAEFEYEHPMFTIETALAQRDIWALQGEGGLWYAGAHLGQGFHEDGLQAGLAVAEAIGGVRRPWRVANESGRLQLPEPQRIAAE